MRDHGGRMNLLVSLSACLLPPFMSWTHNSVTAYMTI